MTAKSAGFAGFGDPPTLLTRDPKDIRSMESLSNPANPALERLWRFCRNRLLQPSDYVELERLCREAGVQVVITTVNLNEDRTSVRLFPDGEKC